jgi:S-formylglutathione hydrolase
MAELPASIETYFLADPTLPAISDYSMGGHGAFTIGLKNPDRYQSISAFAPNAAPMQAPWGQKAFSRYLGTDRSAWEPYDASVLMHVWKMRPRARRFSWIRD